MGKSRNKGWYRGTSGRSISLERAAEKLAEIMLRHYRAMSPVQRQARLDNFEALFQEAKAAVGTLRLITPT